MGVVVFGVYKGIFAVIKVNAIAAILAIVMGAVVYGAMLLLLKGLSEEELKKFPKGTFSSVLPRNYIYYKMQ